MRHASSLLVTGQKRFSPGRVAGCRTNSKLSQTPRRHAAEKSTHMQKALEFLKGKKTYIVALTAAALAFAHSMGWPVPEYVYVILGACGFATVRAAIGKPAA